VNKPDFVKDDETSVSGEAQSEPKEDSARTTKALKELGLVIDRVETLHIPGNTTDDVIDHMVDIWDIDKNADSTSKINSFVGSLERFEELKNRLVADASACTEEEVQELLQRFQNTGQAASDFLIARYGIGTRSSQLHSINLSLMTNEVKTRMEVDLENHQEVFSEPFLNCCQKASD